MKENEYIYKRLKFLSDEVEFLYSAIEKQQDAMESLMTLIKIMQSPEYARKQVNVAKAFDIADKVAFMRETMNKK